MLGCSPRRNPCRADSAPESPWRQGWSYVEDAGGGAFYGPKIDIKVRVGPGCSHPLRPIGHGPKAVHPSATRNHMIYRMPGATGCELLSGRSGQHRLLYPPVLRFLPKQAHEPWGSSFPHRHLQNNPAAVAISHGSCTTTHTWTQL